MATLTTKVQDNFTDTNGTALASHTPDTDVVGGGWTDGDAGWEIQSNEAKVANDTGISSIDSAALDIIVTQVITSMSVTSCGIIIRYQDINNFLLFRIRADINTMDVFDRVSGTYTERASLSQSHSTAESITLKVIVIGDDMTFIDDLNNVILFYSASTFNTETTQGMRSSAGLAGGACDVDSFLVEEIEDNGGGGSGVAKLAGFGGGLVG